jgi:hypothetical protein
MALEAIKYHTCGLDKGDGILLVDIETETVPYTDKQGNRLYFCTHGNHVFAVDAQGHCILCNSSPPRSLPPPPPETE